MSKPDESPSKILGRPGTLTDTTDSRDGADGQDNPEVRSSHSSDFDCASNGKALSVFGTPSEDDEDPGDHVTPGRKWA